jgi:hypothetical protein
MPVSARPTRGVFAPVTAMYFTAAQRDECREFLATRTAHSECVPVVEESQLLMRADGRLVDSGYRFNALGFEALGRALGPGLVALFNDLSGEVSRRPLDVENLAAEIAAAVSVYNTTLRVRFESLRERTLLVNHQERAVEGFLGLDHRLLDNTSFFDMVTASLQDKQPQAEFYRAELVGRELRLYFLDPATRIESSALAVANGHSLAAGWFFSNREDVGQAVKGSLCLYTRFGAALEPLTNRMKVVHTGSDLVGRTSFMVDSVAGRNLDMPAICRQTRLLASTPLHFSDKKAEHDRAIRHWVSYLCRLKLKADTALAVVKSAALVGADLTPRGPLEAYSKQVLAARTAYDLVCSMLRAAKAEYGAYRDVLQGAAMQMFIPEITKKSK